MDARELARLSEMFQLMGEPNRLRLLLACAAGPTPVGEIASALGLSPSLVSHHLRLLRAARLVRADRRGKQVFYGLRDQHIHNVIADMAAHVAEPADPAASPTASPATSRATSRAAERA